MPDPFYKPTKATPSHYPEDGDATIPATRTVAIYGPPKVKTYRKPVVPPPRPVADHRPSKKQKQEPPPGSRYQGKNFNPNHVPVKHGGKGVRPQDDRLAVKPGPFAKNPQSSTPSPAPGAGPSDSWAPPSGPSSQRSGSSAEPSWERKNALERERVAEAVRKSVEAKRLEAETRAEEIRWEDARKAAEARAQVAKREAERRAAQAEARKQEAAKREKAAREEAARREQKAREDAIKAEAQREEDRKEAARQAVQAIGSKSRAPVKAKFRPVVPRRNRRLDTPPIDPKNDPGPFRPLVDSDDEIDVPLELLKQVAARPEVKVEPPKIESYPDEKQDIVSSDSEDAMTNEVIDVDGEERVEGVIHHRREDTPAACWVPHAVKREEARARYRHEMRGKLLAQGKRGVAFLWRPDGLGIEWTKIPQTRPTVKAQSSTPAPPAPAKTTAQPRATSSGPAPKRPRADTPPVRSASASVAPPTSREEYEMEIVKKLQAIERWQGMKQTMPSLALSLQTQIDRVQGEIFALTEGMEVETPRK